MDNNEEKNNTAIKSSGNVAAMDLGTNSNRLLIADRNGVPLFRDVYHVALGEKLAENGHFCRQAMDRAVNSFMNFAEYLDAYNVKRYRAIATAACRMSANTAEFLQEIKQSSGIEVEVISEYEEARLTLLGARLNAPADARYLLVYDLGGGSTEVTLATNGEVPKILATVSIPLGARNATEMFNLYNYNPDGAAALQQAVAGYLQPFLDKIAAIDYHGQAALISTSSTPLRLVSWIKQMPEYDKFAADGVTVATAELDRLIEQILPMPYPERAASIYIGPQRAKIFVAALVIFRTVFQMLREDKMVASLKGAQEAIVFSLLKG